MLEVVEKEDAFAHDFDLGPLTTVVKRNGEKHPFDASKIVVALMEPQRPNSVLMKHV